MGEPEPPPAPPERPASETDWGVFVDTYGRAILEWVRQTGLPAADIQELVRELLAQLAQEFRAVVAAPGLRFRTWLQFAAHQAWGGLAEGMMDAGANGASPRLALLLSGEAHDAFLRSLDTECSHLRRRQILGHVQQRAAPADWEAFTLTVLEGRPPGTVAAALGCDDLFVRAASFRVHRALQQDVQAVEEMY